MRFALPLALIFIIVVVLILASREPEVVPDLSGDDSATESPTSTTDQSNAQNKVQGNQRQSDVFGVSDNRVCVSEPRLIEVSGVELGDTISGFAQFNLDKALAGVSQSSGSDVNTLRALTLSVVIDNNQPDRQLTFDMGGIEAKYSATDSADVALRFPGHVLRNHSIASLVVRNDSGDMQDLAGYSNWMLCGEPVADSQFGKRDVVVNDVSDLNLGPGVNVMGGEYACAQGWGLQHHVAAGVTHSELANMLSAWGVRTVRLPVNEHCWLAESYPFEYLKAKITGRPYRDSVQQLVQLLTSQYQMHVVLDLHWTGTLEEKALELKPLPNHEFSAAFWRDVAEQFAHNNRVVFNLFNEAHVPAQTNESAEAVNASATTTTVNSGTGSADLAHTDLSTDSDIEKRAISSNWWKIWRDGNEQYAGMQSLVDAIRSTGATNHISFGGLDYSADQRGWLSYAPHDPLGRLWVDNHAYPADNKCTDRICWDQTLRPLIANGYGVMFGETGNSIGQHPQGCQADFVKRVYRFARENSIPALAWTFIAGGVADVQTNKPLQRNCQIPTLITRWPGESLSGDLSQNEVTEKKAFDPTPDNLLDDATWPGCVFYAYANGLPLDDFNLPDIDPAEAGSEAGSEVGAEVSSGVRYGTCSAR